MLLLVRINEEGEQLELVGLGRELDRIGIHELGNSLEGCLVFVRRLDDLRVIHLLTPQKERLLYSAWVPTHSM